LTGRRFLVRSKALEAFVTESAHPWSEDQVIPLLNKFELFEGLPDDDLRRIA